MPEEFIKDSEVPSHWRLLALFNGFFISGKSFYATNEWIEKQIGLKQWAISSGITKLEKLGKIRTEGKGSKKRIIYSTAKVHLTDEPSEPTLGNLVNEHSQPSDAPLHTSDSNSEKGIKEKSFLPEMHIEEEPAPHPRVKPVALEEYVSIWNGYEKWENLKIKKTPNNPSVKERLLPKARVTQDLEKAFIYIRRSHSTDDFKIATKNYVNEIINRHKDKEGFYAHRYSLYDFFTRKEILSRYVNK